MATAIPLGLKTFIELLGDGELPKPVKTQSLGAPLWVEGAILHAFQFRFHKAELNVLFIQVDPTLAFDRILALTQAVKKAQHKEVVIIADDLNPRFRPLFVRERVPFVQGEEDIFAPSLGIKLSNLSKLSKQQPDQMVDDLSPLGLKIVAGAITGFLDPDHLKVTTVVTSIQKSGVKISASKVSVVLRELVALGLAKEMGRGPEKYFVLLPKQQLIGQLMQVPTAKLFKRVMTQSRLKGLKCVLSGDSALADYTEMADPDQKVVAIHKRNVDAIEGEYGKDTTQVEVWKEDPRLFSVNGNLNPIELYFSLKPHMHDPRVKKQMAALLQEYGIKLV